MSEPAIPRIPWRGSRDKLIQDFAELVAHAQEQGYRAALDDAGVSDMERNRLVTNYWGLYETRVKLMAAELRTRLSFIWPNNT